MTTPKLIIHGGASTLEDKGGLVQVRESLHIVIKEVYDLLESGKSAVDAVLLGCELLENDPRFNAGTGSVLQSDGQVRMSASLMDGARQRFSGVINVSRIKNPIHITKYLQEQDDRTFSDVGAAELTRELEIPLYDPIIDFRVEEWILERKNNFERKTARLYARASEDRRGTIGVVALDREGRIAAGTSTGGKGLERIGRVSDSATVAGNYANKFAGVSCTGIGEDIVEEALATRIVIRVTDGLSLPEAMERSIKESVENNRDLGAISLDASGAIAWGKTAEILLAAYHTGETIGDTLEWTTDELAGHII